MDKDKLNEAAKHEAYNGYSGSYKDRKEGFIKGAKWLMQQPISDRLTDEEKEKIKEIYWQAMKDWVSIGEARGYCKVGVAIEQIFGAELFNEK